MQKNNYRWSRIGQLRQFYAKFARHKLSHWCFILLGSLYIISWGAEFIAHEKPILIYYDGKIYLPSLEFVAENQLGGYFNTEPDYQDPMVDGFINQKGFAIYPPIRYHYSTIARDIAVAPSPPNLRHWLGTDNEGGDVLARIIYGFRISLTFGLILSVVSSAIGIIMGAIQGYYGGRVDLILQRFLEVWGGMPVLFLLIILASFSVVNFWSLMGLMLLFSWTRLVNLVRAEVLKQRNLDFVRAAKALGVPSFTILLRHILPNSLTATMTYLPFIVAGSVTVLTSLDFIGFGLPPGYPSLGQLLKMGKENLQAPWLGLSGFFVLGLLLTCLIFMGEGLRDAFDPKRSAHASN